MANKRMFSLDVVGTDRFLEMPSSTQALYFHLGMRADNENIVSKPKALLKMCGCREDDFKILLAKGYLMEVENGVCVLLRGCSMPIKE